MHRHIQHWHCRDLFNDMLAVSKLGDDDVQRAERLIDDAKDDEDPSGNGFDLKSTILQSVTGHYNGHLLSLLVNNKYVENGREDNHQIGGRYLTANGEEQFQIINRNDNPIDNDQHRDRKAIMRSRMCLYII